MAVYINTQTGEYPVNEADIRQRMSHVSFSRPFTAPAPYALVQSASRPPVSFGQVVTEGGPQNVDGTWVQTWIVSDAPAEVIESRTQAALAAVRTKRNEKLRATDWIASVVDSPLSAEKKQEWLDYRQALRDMTNVADISQIVWPTEPEA